ncbi:MAG: AAA family ATPase [Prevotella sp.]|nr:AAA family ATPase [Prevotella sp.]
MTDELFGRCAELVASGPTAEALRYLHQTLVLACSEALRGTGQGYGNVFAQVDYLCKRHHLSTPDRIAIQTARLHANGRVPVEPDEWRYDIRALVRFIAAVFGTSVPGQLVASLPANDRPYEASAQIDHRCVRCIVNTVDGEEVTATTADGDITIGGIDASTLRLLRPGVQLNLLDVSTDEGLSKRVTPRLTVFEPDFLVDISSVAACFADYGHHPMSYLIGRLKPRANSQAILLGNYASRALDDIINNETFNLSETIRTSFREQALQFCTCEGFDGARFKADATLQADHLREVVDVLFGGDYHREQAILEPSFVCEQLGLQGRVDLMTTDMRLLVEQKSGKNFHIERPQPGQKGLQLENHYVQLLLYYGILRQNFHLAPDRVDIRLLYSRYPAQQGLLVVNFYRELFYEAIRLRNRIVAAELHLAERGFGSIWPQLRADTLLENGQKADFFNRYVRPEVERLVGALQQLQGVERSYLERMMTFVFREQRASKVGTEQGRSTAAADLWTMPLAEKLDTGNIFVHLTIIKKEQSTDYSGIDRLTLRIEPNPDAAPVNFRRGDGVYLYAYDGEPDVRRSILLKATIEQLTDDAVTVRLMDGQQNPHLFEAPCWAIEHTASDASTALQLRSLCQWAAAEPQRRRLLLGLEAPRRDASVQLSRPYHPHYDDVLLSARQSLDYFLLVGPPGTGKTSMALRFLVEEELGAHFPASDAPPSVLLMAYTNRAVDEICGMLEEARQDYLRIGGEATCDPRYRQRLLDNALSDTPRLADIKSRIVSARIIVGTTSMLQMRPYVFQLKHFSLAIVDEASQILEPGIIGLLASECIRRFILVGDHKQLPAVVQQPDDDPQLRSCRQSLFERLIRQEREAGRTAFVGLLRRQGRMHPEVAAFANEMFYAREQLLPVPLPHQEDTSLHYDAPAEDALDEALQTRRVLFLPSADCADMRVSDKVNASEAHIVADLLRRIYRFVGPERFDADRTVGVIVPYRNQIALIRRAMAQLGIDALQRISIDTVERYQGSQRDVIIYSFTAQRPYQLNFLTQSTFEEDGRTIDRRLNVALTRARCQLLLTGNEALLSRNPLFAELIRRYRLS